MGLIIGHTDPKALLYHYTSASVARRKILPSGKLKFGSFGATNEPREYREWRFGTHTGSGGDAVDIQFPDYSRELSWALKNSTKLSCFSKDVEPLTGDHTKDIHQRGLALPRMWAQYGDRHVGVCLIFDRAKLWTAIREQTRDRWATLGSSVMYRDSDLFPSFDEHAFTIHAPLLKRLGLKQYILLHRQTFGQKLFLEKAKDWEHEREFRFIVVADEPGDLFLEYRDSLVGIVLGDAMTQEQRFRFLDATDHLPLERIGLKWANGCPWYDFGTMIYSHEPVGSPWHRRITKRR